MKMLVTPFCLFVMCAFVHAQGKSAYNVNVSPGYRLLANPFNTTNNLLSIVIESGTPNGATVQKWNPSTASLTPVSTYRSGLGWTIDYSFPPGEGVLFYSPVNATITFVGEVPTMLPEPRQVAGTYLLSSVVPAVTPLAFMYATGRNPYEGESVRRLDLPSQTYFTTTFRNGSWDNGVPILNVAESAYFTLVPEPGTFALLGLGLLFCIFGWLTRNKSSKEQELFEHPLFPHRSHQLR